MAIRNKYRHRKLKGEIKQFIRPSNILLSGYSGSGKTQIHQWNQNQIFRQFARIHQAPFIKVQATRYTEVGYHGDDVENIINELFKKSIFYHSFAHQSYQLARVKILDTIKNRLKRNEYLNSIIQSYIMRLLLGINYESHPEYELKLQQFRDGFLDDMDIYVMNITQKSYVYQKQIKISQIRKTLYDSFINEVIKKINVDQFTKKDIEQRGIVIIDQIDKLVKQKTDSSHSRASDEAVQYDLLPLLDGTEVNIKDTQDKRTFVSKNSSSYITIDTKNILFVGAGAFSRSKPTDLIVELQGRLPITVEMQKLSKQDFEKILKQTEYSLIQQHQKLLETEDIQLCFTQEAISQIARSNTIIIFAQDLNNVKYNTGARRLRTIIEAVLEDIMFEASQYPKGQTQLSQLHLNPLNFSFIIKKKDVTQRTKILYKQKQFRHYLN